MTEKKWADKNWEKKWMNNLDLKILAFFIAALLWFIVANVDNPVTRVSYANIPVEVINDDIITRGGEVYQVVGEQKVSVTVRAKRSVVQTIKSGDIVATADIKEMDAHTGLVPIVVSIPSHSGNYQSAEASPRNLQIQTEKTGKAVFALTVNTVGTPREGCIIGDMKVSPEKITITGAESKINLISRAVARIDVSDISKDKELTADLVLYDSYGNSLSQSQLSNNLGEDGIVVSVKVLETKSVPVSVTPSGTPPNGYRVSECTVEPESVQICGAKAALDAVTSIVIPSSELNVDGMTEKEERTVDIRPYLPEGIKLVEDAAGDVTVSIMIEKQGTRSIDFLVASIKLNGLSEKLQASYEPDAEVTLTFHGEQHLLDILDITNGVSVNLQNYGRPGTYEVPVIVDVPEGITLAHEMKITLVLTEKDNSQNQGGQEGR